MRKAPNKSVRCQEGCDTIPDRYIRASDTAENRRDTACGGDNVAVHKQKHLI